MVHNQICTSRSSHPEVFLERAVLKMYSKFTGEHPCRSAISIMLFCNFIEITLRHGCYPVNLLHIFRTAFPKNTSERLLLYQPIQIFPRNVSCVCKKNLKFLITPIRMNCLTKDQSLFQSASTLISFYCLIIGLTTLDLLKNVPSEIYNDISTVK